jgi:hypothetical protein
MSDPACGCDGGCAMPLLCNSDWDVACADLLDLVSFGQQLNLILIESDDQSAGDYSNGGWNGADFANDRFKSICSFEVRGPRQAMRDHSGFESNDGLACVKRVSNFG